MFVFVWQEGKSYEELKKELGNAMSPVDVLNVRTLPKRWFT